MNSLHRSGDDGKTTRGAGGGGVEKPSDISEYSAYNTYTIRSTLEQLSDLNMNQTYKKWARCTHMALEMGV